MDAAQISYLLIGFIVGAAVIWAWLGSRAGKSAAETALLRDQLSRAQAEAAQLRKRTEDEQRARTAAETSLEVERQNMAEQRRLLEDAEAKLKESFQSLAGQTFQSFQQQFLQVADTRFSTLRAQASGEFQQRQQAIEELLQPMKKSMQEIESELARAAEARTHEAGELTAQVKMLTESSQALRAETGSLVTSLRQPQVKGKWGELMLRRAVELAGMSPHCDFDMQKDIETEEGRRRPDMVIKLPGGAQVVVDAKVPLHAFHKAIEIRTQDEYHAAMEEHARLVRMHISNLSSKAYQDQFEVTPDFVVLFLPGEAYFSAALEKDRSLIEDAIDKRVVLASPTTLIALLRAIATGWQAQRVQENAERISELGKLLYDRISGFAEHLSNMGAGLEKANKAYNAAVGSFEQRLLPGARKFKDLGVSSAEQIPLLEPTEIGLRPVAVPAKERDDSTAGDASLFDSPADDSPLDKKAAG